VIDVHTIGLPPESLYSELVTFTHLNPSPVLVLDAQGHVRYLNLAARQMQKEFDLSDADILKILPTNIVEIMRQCLESGTQARRLESQIQNRWFGWSAYGVPGGQTVYFHGADITGYKKVEKEQNELRLKLVQNDKMASIGQLAAGIAHEINNPLSFVVLNLNHISNYGRGLLNIVEQYDKVATLVKAGSLSPELEAELTGVQDIKAREEFEEILDELPSLLQESQDGAERIRAIVLNLKEFSHTGEGAQKHADINRCLQSTLKIVSYELKYKAKVIEQYGDIPEILCYPQELNQVFMNLLVNASHAIKQNGEIRIVTARRDEQVVVEISDTGCGIPPENLSRIFETFFTTKEVGQGTGLGLSISSEIVKKHQGRIEVESTVGVGTTFRIWLPTGQGGPQATGDQNVGGHRKL
jgi:two-component system, NtrC family, sensor kinase